ncbi:MAG: succinylglutamate desuccinylase [Pedosphaera sp.]|nr:succinylglutamate desuccinylase [Pedosphaera sp.]
MVPNGKIEISLRGANQVHDCKVGAILKTPCVQRTGQNVGGYGGEKIDSVAVLGDCRKFARERGFIEDIVLAKDVELLFLKRPSEGSVNLYISAGIHGDEPAAQLAIRELVRKDAWPSGVNLWICPCLNPSGCLKTTRDNASGIDQNRDYRHLRSSEVAAHVGWLGKQPSFDLHLCLHEDWEADGFYLYEINLEGRNSAATEAIIRVAEVCPIDRGRQIDGRATAEPGIIRPSIDPLTRSDWPEAFWLAQHRSQLGYTLESPSDWPMELRVEGLIRAVLTLIASVGWRIGGETAR